MGFNDSSTLKGHICVSTNGYVVKLKTYIEKTEVTLKHKHYTQVSVREIKNYCTIILKAGTTEARVQYPTLTSKRHAGSLSACAIDSIVTRYTDWGDLSEPPSNLT